MPLNPCFEEKKREKLGYFETLCTRVEERGTRFVRGEIGLVKEFISLFSSNLLRIIKNEVYRKVDYFIYPTGGRLLFQLRDEN